MNYLENHLPEGEKCIAKTRKSLFIFVRELAVALVLVGIALGLQLGVNLAQNIMMYIYIAFAAVLAIFFADNLVRFSSTMLVVTTHKFMYKEDIITIKIFDTQLANVDGVTVEYKTPLRRALNVGNIVIATRHSEHEFRNIARPDRFTAVLNKQAANVADSRIKRVRISFGVPVGAPVADAGAQAEETSKRGQKIKGNAKKPVEQKASQQQ